MWQPWLTARRSTASGRLGSQVGSAVSPTARPALPWSLAGSRQGPEPASGAGAGSPCRDRSFATGADTVPLPASRAGSRTRP
jgi:hypothetical protein